MAGNQGRSAVCSTFCWIIAALAGGALGYYLQRDVALELPVAYGSGAAGFLIIGFILRSVLCGRKQSRVARRIAALEAADRDEGTFAETSAAEAAALKPAGVLEPADLVENAANDGLEQRIERAADDIAQGSAPSDEEAPEPLTLTDPIEDVAATNAARMAEVKKGVEKALQEAESSDEDKEEPSQEMADDVPEETTEETPEDKANKVAAAIKAVEAEVAEGEAEEAKASQSGKKKSVTIKVAKKASEKAESKALAAEDEEQKPETPVAEEPTAEMVAPQETDATPADEEVEPAEESAAEELPAEVEEPAETEVAEEASEAVSRPEPEPETAAEPAPKPTPAAVVENAPKAIQPLQPKALEAPNDGQADDFTAIEGLGVDQQAALYAAGIFHYSQLVSMNRREMAWIDENIPHETGGAADWRKAAIAISRQQS